MHILVIPSWYPTPQKPARGAFFREQTLALQRAGHQVGLLIPPTKFRTWQGLTETRLYWRQKNTDVATSEWNAIPEYRIPWWGWKPALYPPARGDLAVEIFDRYCAERGRPQVIHAHGILYGGYLASVIKQKRNIPFGVMENASVYQRRLIWPDQASRVHQTLQSADYIFAVSPRVAASLNRYAPDREIGLIHNSVNVDFFTPGTEPPTNEAFVFTLIANLNPNKGIDVLLKAFRQAFTTEATRLNIVGEGKQRAALENLTRQLGLTERVQFLGFQPREQVRDIIRASQVVVSSSYHETFGITLVEALACGKPIVATRSGGPDRIVNERNGLLVPTGDPAALAAALRQIYETYGQYDPVQIRAECLATFSDEAMVRRLEEVYTGLVV